MDLEELFKGKHRRGGRDGREERWRRPERPGYPGEQREHRHDRGHDLPSIAAALLRVVRARRWFLAAAAGVLLLILVTGIWVSILLLGYIGEHGVKGLVEAALGLGTRLWEGSGGMTGT